MLSKDCIYNKGLKESIYSKDHELYNTDNVGCKFANEISSILEIEEEDVCKICKQYLNTRDAHRQLKDNLKNRIWSV